MAKYASFVIVLLLTAASAAGSDRRFEAAGWYVFLQPSAEGTFNTGDPLEPFDASLTSDTGYGVSGIVFFGPRISTEFAAVFVKTGIDLEARGRDAGLPRRQSSIIPVTATLQYHMRPQAMIDPYIGVGAIKTFFGEAEEIDDEDLSVDEIEATGIGYVVNLGINVELMEQMGLLLDAKWSPSKSKATGILTDGTEADIELSPLMISLGVSWRF